MNSTVSHRRTRHSARRTRPAKPSSAGGPELRWVHDGSRYRVTLAPEVKFEREPVGGGWEPAELSEDVFASTALAIGGAPWREFLEYLPAAVREFLGGFSFNRMAALHVVSRCPLLLGELTRTPALTAFLAAHLTLRGGERAAWAEIGAVYEREGIFGVLQWLGLPASPQTLAILQSIADPDLPCRLLQPLRAALWEPEVIWTLSRAKRLTDEQLVRACHALAA